MVLSPRAECICNSGIRGLALLLGGEDHGGAVNKAIATMVEGSMADNVAHRLRRPHQHVCNLLAMAKAWTDRVVITRVMAPSRQDDVAPHGFQEALQVRI